MPKVIESIFCPANDFFSEVLLQSRQAYPRLIEIKRSEDSKLLPDTFAVAQLMKMDMFTHGVAVSSGKWDMLQTVISLRIQRSEC